MQMRRDFPPVLCSNGKRLLAYGDRVFVILNMTSCARDREPTDIVKSSLSTHGQLVRHTTGDSRPSLAARVV